MKWLLVGPPRVGKSTTLKRLLGQKVQCDSSSPSTDLAENPIEINLDLKDFCTKATVIPTTSRQNKWKHYSTRELAQIFLSRIKNMRNGSTANAVPGGVPDVDDPGIEIMAHISDLVDDPNFANIVEDVFEDSATVHITDTGGQPEFHEILPILLRGPALYLVFFSLAQKLDEQCPVSFLSSDVYSSYKYVSTYTNAEVLCRLLSHLYHLQYEADPRLSCVISQSLLLATHSDSPCESKRSFDEKIRSMINTKALISDSSESQHYETCFISLDNAKCDDKELENLQNHLIVKTSCAEPVSLPINWFVFHFLVRSKQKQVMKFSECEKLAQECQLNGKEVYEALDYIHHYLGTILFYNVENLNNTVICDPGVLLKAVSCLIVSSFHELKKVHLVGGEILEKDLNEIICEKKVHPDIKAKYIINLMKHFKDNGPVS